MNILLACSVVALAAADVPVDDNTCTEHNSEKPSASSTDHSAQEVEAGGVVLMSKRKFLSKTVLNEKDTLFAKTVLNVETVRIEKDTHTGVDGIVFSATSAFSSFTNWTHRTKDSLFSAIAAPSSGDGTETDKPLTSGTLFLMLMAVCGMVLACLMWQLKRDGKHHGIYDEETQEGEWKNEAWVQSYLMENEREIFDVHLARHLAQGGREDSYIGSDYQDSWMRDSAPPAAAPASSSNTPQHTWVPPTKQLLDLGIESSIHSGIQGAGRAAAGAASSAAAAARSTGELAGHVTGEIGRTGQKVVKRIDKRTGKVLTSLTTSVSHGGEVVQRDWEQARAANI